MLRKLVIIILFFSWFLSSCTDVFFNAGSLCRRSKTITNFGFVGLGAMGMGMAKVISESGILTFGTDINPGVRDKFVQGKIGIAADSLEAMVRQMGEGRKVIWLMVPHGTATDETIASIVQLRQEGLLSEGDIIIDGGNSNHNRHREHAKTLEKAGIILLDAGTS
ncbi:MAG: NAD(P)-binding domain-containing protein, partial [Candidatus Omnitrophica bacterium]|nr:NAD(P)-binding domain-containing protein [Candidatus Omnitrophota bacterium]